VVGRPSVLAAYGCQRSSKKLRLWLIPLHRFLFALQDWHHIFFINFGFSFCNFLIAYPRLAFLMSIFVQHWTRLWRIHLRILSFCHCMCMLVYLLGLISARRISPCCKVLCATFKISFLIFSKSVICGLLVPLFTSVWVRLPMLMLTMVVMAAPSFQGELLKILVLILIDRLRFFL